MARPFWMTYTRHSTISRLCYFLDSNLNTESTPLLDLFRRPFTNPLNRLELLATSTLGIGSREAAQQVGQNSHLSFCGGRVSPIFLT